MKRRCDGQHSCQDGDHQDAPRQQALALGRGLSFLSTLPLGLLASFGLLG